MKKTLKYIAAGAFSAVLLMLAPTAFASADEPAVTDIPASAEEVQSTDITEISAVTSETAAVSDITSQTAVSAVATETGITAAADTEDGINAGWNSKDGKWYFFDGSKFVTGVNKIDGEYYLFAYNGCLKTGWQTVRDKRCYYDSDTHSIVYGWVEYLGNTYFDDRELGKVTGMREIGGRYYIFDDSGIMLKGFVKHGKYFYYCGTEGAVVQGDDKRTPVEIEGESYLIDPKGHLRLGWQTVNGKRRFYDYETGRYMSGWTQYMGEEFYSDIENGKYTGDTVLGDHDIRFSAGGAYQKGMQTFTAPDGSSKIYYFYDSGEYAESQFVKSGNDTYYFDGSSEMLKSWQDIGGSTYYFGTDGKMTTGFFASCGDVYYFSKKGVMQRGVQKIEGSVYGFGTDGVMLYGWQKLGGSTYYFSDADGTASTGWLNYAGKKYYFSKGGVMAVQKYRIGNDTYYFADDGAMRTSWQTIGSQRYNFGTDGKMLTYRHNIGGKNYLFLSTGVEATNGNQSIVLKAISQLGHEGGKPYWTWWGSPSRFEWCACFVSWCAAQCGYTLKNNCPTFISCRVGINWFKQHGQWKGRNYKPRSGDFIFFDWAPDGVADHIGIVDYVEDGIVYTVEGNSGDAVRKKSYFLDSKNIFGFASPNFPSE